MSPEWVSAIGAVVSAVGVAISLFVSSCLVSRQFRHDREMRRHDRLTAIYANWASVVRLAMVAINSVRPVVGMPSPDAATHYDRQQKRFAAVSALLSARDAIRLEETDDELTRKVVEISDAIEQLNRDSTSTYVDETVLSQIDDKATKVVAAKRYQWLAEVERQRLPRPRWWRWSS